MNRIDKIPDFNWSELASVEMENSNPEELLGNSEVAVAIENVAICGLIYESYTSPPWLWFAATVDISLSDLIDMRRLQEEIPSGTLTAVNPNWPRCKRFAEFYGFVETSQSFGEYIIMRKV